MPQSTWNGAGVPPSLARLSGLGNHGRRRAADFSAALASLAIGRLPRVVVIKTSFFLRGRFLPRLPSPCSKDNRQQKLASRTPNVRTTLYAELGEPVKRVPDSAVARPVGVPALTGSAQNTSANLPISSLFESLP
jgi:hypothetical protein